MPDLTKAKEPFRFSTRLHLTELTGLRATNLSQLSGLMEKVPDSCIYHHTHRFLQQHQYLSPEPPNDFAYWVAEILGEDELAEKLASIDTIQYSDIATLRKDFVSVVNDFLKDSPLAKLKFARLGEEFYFMKSMSFILPANFVASDLSEFAQMLKYITFDSLYFHVFESRLRLGKGENDFSNWIENSLGDKALADKISRLDPYTYTLEELRKKLIWIIKERIFG